MSSDPFEGVRVAPTEDVIIIDDEQSVIDTLEMYCENLGCFRNIITATDGLIGASKLSNQRFALILLDVNMPKLKGDDIIKKVLGESNINSVDSVCVVSGNINKSFLTDALENGVKHYLVKPFTEEQFREKAAVILKTTAPEMFQN